MPSSRWVQSWYACFTPMYAIAYASMKLALTAASPIWRGYLSDVDCRWNVISSTFDDRTAGELGRTVNLLASLQVVWLIPPIPSH